MSIRELPDGTALLRCFAGCSAEAVTEAVGLTMRDLFVRKPQSNRPSQSGAQGNRSVPDALRAATFESLVVLVCAEDMARGKALTDADRERLHTAVVRLHRAAEALRGHH